MTENKPTPTMSDSVRVPRKPTEAMWSGLARQIVFWNRGGDRKGSTLYRELELIGMEAPDWLKQEIPDRDHVPPKGSVAVAIYKAMLAAAPAPADVREAALEECARIADEWGEPQYGHDDQVARQFWHLGEKHTASGIAKAIRALASRPAMDEARLREIALQIAREDWSHGWWPTEEEIERGDINDKAWIRGSVIPNNEKQLAEDAEKLLPIIRRAVSVYGGS